MKEIHFVAFGNDELKAAEPIRIGDIISCPRNCGEPHQIQGGKDEKGQVTDTVMFYKCGRSSYLAGVAGKSVLHRFRK